MYTGNEASNMKTARKKHLSEAPNVSKPALIHPAQRPPEQTWTIPKVYKLIKYNILYKTIKPHSQTAPAHQQQSS